jgi:predicted RNase H-like HicB family nuclease
VNQFYTFVAQAHPDEEGWVIFFPDLPGCMTQADTWDEVAINARDAFDSWMDVTEEHGMPIPTPSTGDDILDVIEYHLADDTATSIEINHIPPLDGWGRRVVSYIRDLDGERKGYGDSVVSSLRDALKDELRDD